MESIVQANRRTLANTAIFRLMKISLFITPPFYCYELWEGGIGPFTRLTMKDIEGGVGRKDHPLAPRSNVRSVLFSGILFNVKWKHGQGCIK